MIRCGTARQISPGSDFSPVFQDCAVRGETEQTGDHPIKKWAALAALIAAFFYLLLSGAEVATQRSFIMTAIVLIAVMVDRSALTLAQSRAGGARRDAARPGSGGASELPMSFAATLALIAAYERGLPWTTAGADTSFGARVAL